MGSTTLGSSRIWEVQFQNLVSLVAGFGKCYAWSSATFYGGLPIGRRAPQIRHAGLESKKGADDNFSVSPMAGIKHNLCCHCHRYPGRRGHHRQICLSEVLLAPASCRYEEDPGVSSRSC